VAKRVVVLKAVEWIRSAWDSVNESCIVICFAAAGLSCEKVSGAYEDTDALESELSAIIHTSEPDSLAEAEMQFEINEEDSYGNILSLTKSNMVELIQPKSLTTTKFHACSQLRAKFELRFQHFSNI